MLHREVQFGNQGMEETGGLPGDIIVQAEGVCDQGLRFGEGDKVHPYYWRNIAARPMEGAHVKLWILGRPQDISGDTVSIDPITSPFELVFNFSDVQKIGTMEVGGTSDIHSAGITLSFGSVSIVKWRVQNDTIALHEYKKPHLRGNGASEMMVGVTREGLIVPDWEWREPIDHVVVFMRGLRGCSSQLPDQPIAGYVVFDAMHEHVQQALFDATAHFSASDPSNLV